jgi:hypothetical protein
MNQTVRVATVLATGRRYLVVRLSFNGVALVHCCGEVVGYRGARATVARGGKTYAREQVELHDLPATAATMRALAEETIAAHRAAGHVVTVSGRRRQVWTDHGTPAQKALNDELAAEIGRAVARLSGLGRL